MRVLRFSRPVPVQDSVVGTLQEIDSREETITVQTPMGSETLQLPSSAVVHQGARTLPRSELAHHSSERVKVWYRASGGARVVTEVRLAGR